MKRARARRRSSALPTTSFNLASMIDVVFLLLIYFLLIAEFSRPELAMATDLPAPMAPRASDPFALPERPVTITVHSLSDHASDLILQADHPALADVETRADLLAALQAADLAAEISRFVVRPAADARWEHALAAFNDLKRAGVRNITLTRPLIR